MVNFKQDVNFSITFLKVPNINTYTSYISMFQSNSTN